MAPLAASANNVGIKRNFSPHNVNALNEKLTNLNPPVTNTNIGIIIIIIHLVFNLLVKYLLVYF
ncbi:hypothetical protein EK904_005849 [Melospiza melodia maxima]|nr:hypothetical protein EK904_005849 [Melospiza melodia maxima]